MKPDQHRVQTLLTDTVTLLCRNGLQYKKELKVQGLLGITLDDDDVFVVHIDKIFGDSQKTTVTTSDSKPVKVSNIPPTTSSDFHQDNHDSVSFFESMCNSTALGEANNIQITNIPPSTAVDDYESNDGSDKLQIDEDVHAPRIIKSFQTSILNRKGGVAKKTTSNKGVKRPVGAAKRKESRCVKQRLSSSFTPQEVHVKDEPPDQMIINPVEDNLSVDGQSETEEHSMNSLFNSNIAKQNATGNHTRANTLINYNIEDFDSCSSGATNHNNTSSKGQDPQAVDMIECLLYNEGVDQSENDQVNTSGIYKRIHISGAEDSTNDAQDEADMLAGCSAWEDSMDAEATTPAQTHSKPAKSTNKSTSSPSTLDDTVTYSGVLRQDINESLVAQYRDLLEAAAVQGDGYPCVECDQVLKTRAIWMEHMKGVHMNRKYACPHCGETFKWRSSRKRHVLITHSNETAEAEMDTITTAPEAEASN